ncbi:hypothetical protein L6452_28584 [Arctium lappa]|uniref:Uncharacterized protein n=1 Tax=Arctium lappa TaxID=4217 RepID=A0ACB8ZXV2_ARCLA|nr:hypothetical protein L6452_28584 [Arctium lappa]
MENHRRQKAHSTGDLFTFPPISRDIGFDPELADQLFSNGKLLLHAFPVQPATFTVPRSTILSRTSSISSKGSLMSSRSNSTNSRSSNSTTTTTNSSCSSARTTTSEGLGFSNRRKLSPIDQVRSGAIKAKTSTTSARFLKKEGQNRMYCSDYGRSQRWQFIAPVPALNRRNSLKKRKGGDRKEDGGVRKGICRRFLRWIVSTCQECHAIEPSKRLKVSM